MEAIPVLFTELVEVQIIKSFQIPGDVIDITFQLECSCVCHQKKIAISVLMRPHKATCSRAPPLFDSLLCGAEIAAEQL